MNFLFDEYKFHDNKIHAIIFIADIEAFISSVVLDIDYIHEWIPVCTNDENLSTFSFKVSKAQLIFDSLSSIRIDIKCEDRNKLTKEQVNHVVVSRNISPPYIFIDKVEASITNNPDIYRWGIKMVDGISSISFEASMYKLHFIGHPIYTNEQSLTEEERKVSVT